MRAHWVHRVLLLAPAALLLVLAVPRFLSGLAVDAAYPVPAYAILDVRLPAESYRVAARLLTNAPARDGDTLITRADVGLLAGMSPAEAQTLLREGLARNPASVRGWMLLAERTESSDRAAAAAMLGNSLLLGQYEYFVAARRARLAARLWDVVPDDARDSALLQARLLWSEKSLNREVERLLGAPGGAMLMTAALRDDPETMRALNRWISARRRERLR